MLAFVLLRSRNLAVTLVSRDLEVANAVNITFGLAVEVPVASAHPTFNSNLGLVCRNEGL